MNDTATKRAAYWVRVGTLRAAWSRYLEQSVHGAPNPQPLPDAVWITLPPDTARGSRSLPTTS